MRKPKVLFLSLVMAVAALGGCSDDSSPSAPPEDTNPISSSQPAAAFADSNLEAAVRTALGGLTGMLTTDTLLSLERLSARDQGIVDLHGIEQLQHLQALDLSGNRIVDLTPLAGLIRLEFLDLTANQVQDLSPLAGLDSLQFLALAINPTRDLTPLLGLGRLQGLEVQGAPLSQEAEQRQISALRQQGVDVLWGAEVQDQSERPDPATRIAFIGRRDPAQQGFQLYVTDSAGGEVAQLTAFGDLAVQSARWSPDRARVALSAMTIASEVIGVSSNGMPLVVSNTDIYLADSKGGGLVNLTGNLTGPRSLISSKYKEFPIWSPDGSRIAFYVSSGSASGLWVINLDGTDPHPLVVDPELEGRMSFETLSPQWDRIAFLSGVGAKRGTTALYVSDTDGMNWTMLVDAVVDVKMPEYFSKYIVWSPDGQRIAFVSNRDGNRELYVVDVDGSNLTRLTYDDGYDTACAWSPDGRWLAFDTNRETRWNVFVLNVESKASYNLTRTFANEYVCDWFEGE